ncbi:MAG: hypothetical protein GY757_02255, partial [bacterium]|nr:hypothetical protein [bacterium]
QITEGENITFTLEEKDTRALKALALEEDVTLFMLLISAYYLLLHKLTHQEDIIIGTPVAGRRHADTQEIIGVFINTLSLRNHPNREQTFCRFLAEVKENTLQAFENQDYPFEDLVEKVKVNRDIARNPIFDVMFTLLNMEQAQLEIPGLVIKPHPFEKDTSKFDISLTGSE